MRVAGSGTQAQMLTSPSLVVGAVLCGLVVLSALVSLAWTPFPADQMNIAARLQGPDTVHWLGTDHFGRDVAARLLEGARNALVVGTLAVAVGMGVGVVTGLAAAALAGGWLDEALMRAADFTFDAVISECTIFGPGDADHNARHMNFATLVDKKERLIKLGCITDSTPWTTLHIGDNGGLTYSEQVTLGAPHGVTPGYDGMWFAPLGIAK